MKSAMKRARYPAEFKADAVKQVMDRGHRVVLVAKRLGISNKNLHLWVRQSKVPQGLGSGETAGTWRLLVRAV